MNRGEIIIYQDPNGTAQLDVRLEEETVWLMQEQIAYLFGTKRPAVTKHFGNIFQSDELEGDSVCSKMEHTAADSKKLSPIPGNGLKSRIFITAGRDLRNLRADKTACKAELKNTVPPCRQRSKDDCFPQVATCGYENKALRAITPQENFERIFFETITIKNRMSIPKSSCKADVSGIETVWTAYLNV
jgi:hypothetical protein